MAVFTGAGVAIVTPFKADGEVNYEKFAELIEDQIAGGRMRSSYAELQESLPLLPMRNIWT